MKSFASDNYAGVLPEVMEALQRANVNHASSYGNDSLTQRVIQKFREIFGAEVDVFFVFNGTGANVLNVASAVQSHQSVLIADVAHYYNDESSAPETFTGCRFFPVPSNSEGKLEPEAVRSRLIRKGDVHYAQPKLLSATQSTEYGTVYTVEELKSLAALCQEHGLYFHIDGSRFFNAAASLDVSLKELATDTGADLLSLGGTKLGMMFGEAVVVFNKTLSETVRYKQKQSMQLASKTRFIAAQFEAILENGLWQTTAVHSNQMAQLLQEGLKKHQQIRITRPVHANAVFAEMPVIWSEALQEYFPFYVWKEKSNEVRLMCAWDTQKEDVEAFIGKLGELASDSAQLS